MYQKLARVLIVPAFVVFFSAFYYNRIVENDYISLQREFTSVSENIIPYRIKGIYFHLTEKTKRTSLHYMGNRGHVFSYLRNMCCYFWI